MTGDAATALTTMNGTAQEIKAQENENLKKSLERELKYGGAFKDLVNELTSSGKDTETMLRKVYDILGNDQKYGGNDSMHQLQLKSKLQETISAFSATGQSKEEAIEHIVKTIQK